MTHAKVQHYVPQFVLRGFADPDNGRVHVFDKQTDNAFVTKPKRVAAVSAFYDLDIPEGILTLEPALVDLESAAFGIIERIRERESIAGLSEEDRHVLSVFVAAQHLRTEHFRRTIEDLDRQLSERLREMGVDPNNVGNYRPFAGGEEVKAFSLEMLAKATVELAPHVLTKDWVLIRTSPDHPFVIGDNPVALHNDRDFGFYGNIGFAVPGIEIYLPISSALTLYFTCRSNGDGIRESWQKLEEIKAAGVGDEETERLERGLSPMYNALTNEVPLPANPDNVLHHNSLQISYAGRWVFSGRGDFSLVEEMISDNPKFREGPYGQVG